MIKRFFHRLKIGNRVAVLQYIYKGNEENEIQLLVLKRKGNRIDSNFTIQSISSLQDIKEKLSNEIPIILYVDGQQIIHRKISKDKEDDYLAEIFPHNNHLDFYLQVTQSENSESAFISVIRSSTLYDLYNQLKINKYFIIDCVLGPFILNEFVEVIDLKNQELSLDYQNVTIDEHEIVSIQQNQKMQNKEINFLGQTISSKILILFLTGLNYFTRAHILTTYKQIVIEANEYFQKRIYILRRNCALFSFLILLTINYSIYNKFENINQVMREKLTLNDQNIKTYEKLKEGYDSKLKYLKNNDLLDKSRISFFADQLALKLPEKIILTELNFNPVNRKNNENGSVEFQHHLINVKGECLNSLDLNKWINQLSTSTSWVDKVNELNYKFINEKLRGEFSFKIILR